MFCVTTNVKNIVVHDNINIGSLANVRGSMELSGMLGDVIVGL